MEVLEELIDVLEISVKRKGEKPLTNLYLLNIMKMVKRNLEFEEEKIIFAIDNANEHYWRP